MKGRHLAHRTDEDDALSEFYSCGPLMLGSALNITVWSYVDQISISVLTDDQTFNDPHELTDAMVNAFLQIRRAAGQPAELVRLHSVMAP